MRPGRFSWNGSLLIGWNKEKSLVCVFGIHICGLRCWVRLLCVSLMDK